MNRTLRTGITVMVMAGMLMTPVHAEQDLTRLNTHLQLVDTYAANQYFDKAIEHINAALELTDPVGDKELIGNLYLKLGSIYMDTNEYDQALEAFDKSLEANPESYDTILYKAQVYLNTGVNDKAAVELQKYIDATGDSSVLAMLAQIYDANGQSKEALEAYENFASQEEETPETIYQLAVYRMTLGMYAEAGEGFEKVAEDETYGMPAKYNLALCKMNSGAYAEAIPYLDACIEANAGYDGMYYNRAVSNMQLGNYEPAIADFEQSMQNESYAEDALYNTAICMISLEQYTQAAEQLTKYIETYPESVNLKTVQYYRGVCYLSAGDFTSAEADFNTCCEADETDYDSLFYRGLCRLQNNDIENAQKDFDTCVTNSDNKDRARYYRALTYEAQQNWDLAIRDLTKCITNEYDLFNTYQARARLYQEKGDEAKYMADLEESLKY